MQHRGDLELAAHCAQLVKRYDDVTAVNQLDLDIQRGECLGLLGPNGAGKTTTIEILEGLTSPDEGVVEVLGMRWGKDDERIRHRIGVQLQESQLGDKLTVREVLCLFRSLYDRSRPLDELLDMFELRGKADTRIHKLSGGQKQRVALSCALVSDPDLLFLDEPTTGLDPQARRKVWDIVSQYKQGGGTVLITSHYMEECSELCDRVAIMDHGKRIALGTPDELIHGLGKRQVVEFRLRTRDGRILAPGVDALPSLDAIAEDGVVIAGEWWTFQSADVSSSLPGLLSTLENASLQLLALRTREPTLEDVFLALTGRSLRDG